MNRQRAGQTASDPVDRAERRQLTLLFCDLEDSVGLSTRLDPEDLRDLIAAYQRVCAEAIERYDGYVARYVGDGILAYFGYPVAHEDNAERAIRAGLDLVEAVARLKNEQFAELNVRVRIGIATGLVIVGDANAQGIVDQGSVVGEAANLAARLQGIARPNTVVVSDVTRHLAMESFDYRDLGRQSLKGFAAAIPVYQVMGPRDVTRLEARGPLHTAFIGRHDELAIFADRWKRALKGDGQFVVLAGPAGIGKSRTVAEAAARFQATDGPASRPPRQIALQCSPYHANTPLYPVRRHLLRRAGINTIDDAETRRRKLARQIALAAREDAAPDEIQLSLLSELVGAEPDDFANAGIDPIVDPIIDPGVRRALLVDALLPLLVGRDDAATLLVFEDVQWIDPTSKALLGRLGRRHPASPTLVVATLRADGTGAAIELLAELGLVEPDGSYPDHVTIHGLKELNAANGRRLALAAATSEGVTLEAHLLDAVVAHSAGLPLYLEQLVKAAAGGFDPAADRRALARDAVLPSTIDDALMAELDRLGPAKAVAQQAAVIGLEFGMGLLARILERSFDELVPLLLDLERARILERSAGSPDGYRFRHSLLHEIAYRSLLRKTRRQIHLAVAHELCQQPEEAQASDDLIARHFALGEQHGEAVAWWRRGAAKAIARSANEEAIAMLQAALDSLGKQRGARQPELELELVLAQAMAMRSLRGYSAPEVEQTLLKARDMAEACGDAATRFSVGFGLFQCTIVKGDVEAAQARAASLLELAGPEPGEARIDAYLAKGIAAFSVGEFVPSIEYHELAAAMCRPESDLPRFLTHGQNAGLFCLSYMARTQCMAGRLDQGRATMRRARQIAALRAQDPGHVHSLLNTAIHAVRVYHLCGDLVAERRLADETVELARRHHYAYYEALGQCHLAWVTGQEDDLDNGIAGLSAGIDAVRQTGTSLALPGFQVLLAQLCIRAGRLEEAASLIAAASSVGEYAMRASDIERTRGDLLAADWVAAEEAYRASLAIARRQNAGLFAVMAADRLARLLHSRGRLQEAHEVLHEALASLSEGDDVLPIVQARATLHELEQSVRLRKVYDSRGGGRS